MAIPAAATLYERYFSPWIPEERASTHPGLLPDMEQIELPAGGHIRDIHPLMPDSRPPMKEKVDAMGQACEADWQNLLKLTPAVSLAGIAAYDAWCTPAQLEGILKNSAPNNFSNPYLILCCECGAAVGEVLQRENPQLQWIYDWPYWDSFLFDLNTMTKFHVFHWAVKRMSSDGEEFALKDIVDGALDYLSKP